MDCIEWQGYCDHDGYARRGAGGRGTKYVHRQVWIDAHGPIPDGLEVMHLCNNPPCVNLEHLQLGTHAENVQMAARAGRLRGSVPGHRGKLTPRQRIAVRHMHRCGMQQRKIAEFFGVSRETIRLTVI